MQSDNWIDSEGKKLRKKKLRVSNQKTPATRQPKDTQFI